MSKLTRADKARAPKRKRKAEPLTIAQRVAREANMPIEDAADMIDDILRQNPDLAF